MFCFKKIAWPILALLLYSGSSVLAQSTAIPTSKPSPAKDSPVMAASTSTPAVDPFAYMEEVMGAKALAWVREQNAVSTKLLEATPNFKNDQRQILDVLNNKDRIQAVSRRGDYFYNLLLDSQYKVGLWRRTTLSEYKKKEPKWETILDLDQLAKTEKENWVWGGAVCDPPSYNRCLLSLSRGGADAKVVREFDLTTRQFVAGGFELPEAKSSVAWVDSNTVLVSTDFGTGTLTASGYARQVKLWRRGTPLAHAQLIYEAKTEDVAVIDYVKRQPNLTRIIVGRAIDFYRSEQFLVTLPSQPNGPIGLTKINIPDDASLTLDGSWAYLELRSDLQQGSTQFKSGSLLVSDAQTLLAGKPSYASLFTPTPTSSLAEGGLSLTRDGALLTILDNVAGRLEEWRMAQGQWTKRAVKAPTPGDLSVQVLHDDFVANDPYANDYFLTYTDFLTPTSLLLGRLGSDERELVKQNPQFFDATGMRSEQRFAVSKDKTRVPYFVVYPKDFAAGKQTAPTLLYGYGGFQVSLSPWYSGTWGRTWLSRGGVFVVANIRGGGEFGPQWHQAALKANKQKSYDDFAAVAQDLAQAGITTPAQLGIMGGSNGGLLVGAAMTQRPELYGAVVCQVPLLDMKAYHKLLAGNSWMAEYGDPDKPEEWAFISQYSPYHNVRAGQRYPRVLFATSTRDDRVHPAHARKMAALMMSQGRGTDQVLYYENIEGGHGGAANNEQRAYLSALEMNFLWDTLGQARR